MQSVNSAHKQNSQEIGHYLHVRLYKSANVSK